MSLDAGGTAMEEDGDLIAHDGEAGAAAALRHIARDEQIKAYVLRNPPLYDALLRAALRFIGGETLPECLAVASTLNGRGFATTIDHMGESTRDATMARYAADEFLRVIRAIAERKLDSSVSLDLSHIGLAVGAGMAKGHAGTLAQAARDAGIELMVSMEGSERTGAILDLHRRLCERFDNVGLTLQANLNRTEDDMAAALARPGRIRLVKGAYEEPADIARTRGPAVDAAYRDLMQALLASGHACSIATHDPVLLDQAHAFIQAHGLNGQAVEFEMLYGITPERLQAMRDRGYRTRIYLPYGREWYLYLCHRLAEYPPNIYRAIGDAVGMAGEAL